MSSRITYRFGAELGLITGETMAVRVALSWASRDPCAVCLTIANYTSSWTFARELLALGPSRRNGHGEVQVSTSPSAPNEDVLIRLQISSPHPLTLTVWCWDIQRFLEETFAVVPLGHEIRLELRDAELAQLLDSD